MCSSDLVVVTVGLLLILLEGEEFGVHSVLEAVLSGVAEKYWSKKSLWEVHMPADLLLHIRPIWVQLVPPISREAQNFLLGLLPQG